MSQELSQSFRQLNCSPTPISRSIICPFSLYGFTKNSNTSPSKETLLSKQQGTAETKAASTALFYIDRRSEKKRGKLPCLKSHSNRTIVPSGFLFYFDPHLTKSCVCRVLELLVWLWSKRVSTVLLEYFLVRKESFGSWGLFLAWGCLTDFVGFVFLVTTTRVS